MHPRLATLGPKDLAQARAAVRAIQNGPRALQLACDLCVRCGRCAKACHVSRASPERRHHPAGRAELLRAFFRRGQGPDAGTLAAWMRDFYECTGCRRCAVFCPLGLDNSVITRKARSILHGLGLTPCRIAATQETSDAKGNNEGASLAAIRDMVRFLEEEAAGEHGAPIRIPLDERADVLFATASSEIIARPENLLGCAAFFHAAGISWTLSSRAFDAANFGLFSGDDAHLGRKNRLLHEACLDLGVRALVIGECGHAFRVARYMGGATSAPGLPYAVTDIFTLAADVLGRGGVTLDPSRNPEAVTYHDPCNFGRSGGIMEAPRQVLRACVADFREMRPNREENFCCGGGGGLAVLETAEGTDRPDTFYEFRMKVAGRMKLEQITATGAALVAAPCFNCLRQIEQLMDYHETGVRVTTVFELFDRALRL
uniref:Fe-S oxidoreductase n=1 Tax=Desulfovibrio sp. U5L TaxID=596152 RepID=I2PXY7_9BACT